MKEIISHQPRSFGRETSKFMTVLRHLKTASRLGFATRGEDIDIYLLTDKSLFDIPQEKLTQTMEAFSGYSNKFPDRNLILNIVDISKDKLVSFEDHIVNQSKQSGGTFRGIKSIYGDHRAKGPNFAPFPDWSKKKS